MFVSTLSIVIVPAEKLNLYGPSSSKSCATSHCKSIGIISLLAAHHRLNAFLSVISFFGLTVPTFYVGFNYLVHQAILPLAIQFIIQ